MYKISGTCCLLTFLGCALLLPLLKTRQRRSLSPAVSIHLYMTMPMSLHSCWLQRRIKAREIFSARGIGDGLAKLFSET